MMQRHHPEQFMATENTPRPKCSGPNGRNTQKEFLKKRSLFFRFSSRENLCHSVAEKIPGYTPDMKSINFSFQSRAE
jgi:hypothetical protein